MQDTSLALDLTLIKTDTVTKARRCFREISLVDGTILTISGYDDGPELRELHGMDAREFHRGFTADETAELATLLGTVVGIDLLTTLDERFENTADIEAFARDNGVPGDRINYLYYDQDVDLPENDLGAVSISRYGRSHVRRRVAPEAKVGRIDPDGPGPGGRDLPGAHQLL